MHLHGHTLGVLCLEMLTGGTYDGFVLGVHGYEGRGLGEECGKSGVVIDKHVAGRRTEKQFDAGHT